MKGTAASLLKDCRENVKSFETLRDRLVQHFNVRGREIYFRAQLRSRRRKPGETLQELFVTIGDLMYEAYPGKGSDLRDTIACDAFLDALNDNNLEQRVRDRAPRSLDEAYQMAVTMEANSTRARMDYAESMEQRREVRAITVRDEEEPDAATCAVFQDLDELKAGVKQLCKAFDRFVSGKQRRELQEERRCFCCDKPGHVARMCPSRGDEGRFETQDDARGTYQVHGVTKGDTKVWPSCVELEYKGTTWECVLDSGAECSMIPPDMLVDEEVRAVGDTLYAINGQQLKVVGGTEVVLKAGRKEFKTRALVVNGI